MKRIYLFLLIILHFNHSRADVHLQYEKIGMEQGLPTVDLYCIYQDKEGFIWFGSGDGLCRWDGYEIKVFKSDYNHPNLLTHNWVNCIAEDADNNLWIGTQFGLDIFDKKTGTTRHFSKRLLSNQTVCTILVTSNNEIYVGTNFGLNKYNPETDDFTHYYADSHKNSVCGNDIKALMEDSKGDIWIGTWTDGLCKYSPKQGIFIHYPKVNERNSVHSLFEDKDGNIWFGSWECGLNRIVNPQDPQKCRYITYRNAAGNPNSLSHNTVYSIAQDNVYGYIWIGTPTGLNLMTDIQKDSFIRYENADYELNAILRDQVGMMWLALNGYGIKKIQMEPDKIRNYSFAAMNQQFETNSIFAIYEYPDDIFWLGTKQKGIIKYNRRTNTYTSCPDFERDNSLNLKMKTISSFHQFPSDNRIWATSFYSGIYIIDGDGLHDRSVQRIYQANTPNLVSDNISNLFMDKDGNLWIGSRGLNIFNKKDSLTIYSIEDRSTYNKISIQTDDRTSILSIIQDRKGNVWLGTENNGVYRATINGNSLQNIRFEPYNRENGKINNNNVQQIYEDSEGELWAATKGGGLSRYNPNKDVFTMVGNMNEIPGDNILNILEDKFNNLWLSTNKGIVRYNSKLPKEQQVKIFTSSDGIQNNVFNRGAFFKNTHGEMFFGGYQGFNSFFPEKIKENKIAPPIVITDIKIFNKSIEDFSSEEREKISSFLPNYSDKVKLTHQQYNFRIEFSGLALSNSEKNRYAYMLQGFDSDWQYVDANHRYANYNNLSPGTYTFLVKASNESGVWNDSPKKVLIEILPAPYQTWWARTLYALFILGLIYLLYLFASNKMKISNALKIQKMEHEKMDELNQSKLQFFTNISHELLTPLTVLSCAVDELSEAPGHSVKTLDTMRLNINRLIRLLQQILEFRKAESGNLKLKVSQGDVAQFIRSLCNENFKPLSDNKHISLQVDTFPESIIGWFDTDKLDKILYNLISNAFKYNYEGGNISITLQGIKGEGTDKYLFIVLKVNNTGQGISSEALPTLFKRFYEGDYRKYRTKGTGIGLSLTKDLVNLHKDGEISVRSEVNKFTEFTVKLPIAKEYFNPEQIDGSMCQETPVYMEEEHYEYDESEEEKNTLLIIEDNVELLTLMSKVLSSNYKVLTATDGEEGLAVGLTENPDLIISDIMMPQMDGYELCQAIKKDIRSSHIPVILLTAKLGKKAKIESFEAGADLYIPKPFEMEVLKAQIRSLLNNRKLVTERFLTSFSTKEMAQEFTSLDEQFLDKAMTLIKDNISNPDFNLAFFQESMNVTSSMLYRKFKALTGMPPLEIIRKMRLETAVEIMKQNKCSTAEIAYAVGYNDPKYFSNCFKKVYKMLPSEYMDQIHSK